MLLGIMGSMHLFRRQASEHPVPGQAFEHLVRAQAASGRDRTAALLDAEAAFRRGIGSLWIDPLALIGLALVDAMGTELGRPLPPEPAPSRRDDGAALAHARILLQRGYPQQAGTWLARARFRHPQSEPLQQLQVFGELWLSAGRVPAPLATEP